ncbi:winged helix-turn-helix domain-containing protein [Paraburkholderia sp. J8-2]|uniref:winged helix-turn-helix domain-containing protein n=1 Tax=Paraburkholderia sp. J8-2 TaxID=2805440 RepID=UPI002AB646ED|nr:winged helix-turn-helix domain-containing protein [Paraburkholderia sp. J8-2]
MMYPATHSYPLSHTIGRREQLRWRPDFARIRGKIYLAVADQIEQAILAGIFQPGDALPTQRSIADDLGFHLNTINAAFREVARRGLIESRTRRGSVVSFGPRAA